MPVDDPSTVRPTFDAKADMLGRSSFDTHVSAVQLNRPAPRLEAVMMVQIGCRSNGTAT